MATIVTGGTGFVGRCLLGKLRDVMIVSRHPEKAARELAVPASQIIPWDANSGPFALPIQIQPDVVVNLMGEPIAGGRWTDTKKQSIRSSRVDGTNNLVDGLLAMNRLPKVFVSASAMGFYGPCGEELLDEASPNGSGFLAETCRDWEKAAFRLLDHGVRVVVIRLGVVLGRNGGALHQMVPIFRWGLGGRLGNGQQWFPWIHLDDLVRMIEWAITSETASGVYNGVAPNSVKNADFTRELAKQLHRPALLHVPEFVLQALFGEFANTLFDSQRVIPRAAIAGGFEFQFPNLADALRDLLP